MQSALFRANIKPPVELVVANLDNQDIYRDSVVWLLVVKGKDLHHVSQDKEVCLFEDEGICHLTHKEPGIRLNSGISGSLCVV